MKQFFYLSVFCAVALTACTGAFKKGDNGLEYKIIANGSGKTLSYGDYMQIHVTQVYAGTKDTVLQDTRNFMPLIQLFDSAKTPPAYYKILRQVRKGDSLIIRMPTDTVFKDSPESMPPYMKKGKLMYTHVRIINIFKTEAEADSANKAERILAKPRAYKRDLDNIEKEIAANKAQIEADGKLISEYLAKNNIKAEKTKWGTYISIQTEGTGELISNKDIVTVNYTGRTLDSGKVVDSNVDPQFQHTQPYQLSMGALREIMPGWIDALQHMKNGTKAVFFVPSSLAYGKTGNRGIKPDTNLYFDIEVLKVENEEALMALQQEMQKKMMEAERMRVDSIEKATRK